MESHPLKLIFNVSFSQKVHFVWKWDYTYTHPHSLLYCKIFCCILNAKLCISFITISSNFTFTWKHFILQTTFKMLPFKTKIQLYIWTSSHGLEYKNRRHRNGKKDRYLVYHLKKLFKNHKKFNLSLINAVGGCSLDYEVIEKICNKAYSSLEMKQIHVVLLGTYTLMKSPQNLLDYLLKKIFFFPFRWQ